jgi:hypoxanthine phosphoribosyltransferase
MGSFLFGILHSMNMESAKGHIKYHEDRDSDRGSETIKERDATEIMQSIRYDIGLILDKIRPAIESHTYDIVIGVDGGGRLPALVLGKTLDTIYHAHNEEKTKTFFLAGTRDITPWKLDEKLEKLNEFFKQPIFEQLKNSSKKVLLVEDVIQTGRSLSPIVKTLKKLGINYEVVTLSFVDTSVKNPTFEADIDIQQIEDVVGAPIIYGEYGGVSSVYGSRQMAGVQKNSTELFSTTLKEKQNREILAYTRSQISDIAKNLSDNYLSNSPLKN